MASGRGLLGSEPARMGSIEFRCRAVVYLIAITLGEVFTTYGDVRWGMFTHCFSLLGIFVYAHLARERKAERAFAISLAFAPLIRIVSLALPLAGFPLLYWYVMVSIPLFFALGTAARSLDLPWSKMGMTLRGWPLQLLIGLTGLVFGAAEYVILRPEPLVPVFTWRAMLWPAFVLMICTGLLEEMIFRGLMQRTGRDALGRWNLLYISVLFAVLHLGHRSLIDVLFVWVVGYFFAWIAERTRSLLGVTLSHGLTNIMLFLVLPLMAAGPPAGLAIPGKAPALPPATVPVAAILPATPTAAWAAGPVVPWAAGPVVLWATGKCLSPSVTSAMPPPLPATERCLRVLARNVVSSRLPSRGLRR